jgi:hypothetical protein
MAGNFRIAPVLPKGTAFQTGIGMTGPDALDMKVLLCGSLSGRIVQNLQFGVSPVSLASEYDFSHTCTFAK